MKVGWKIAVAMRDDLAMWQKLNATAFVVSGLGTRVPDLIGEPYGDASGRFYLPKFGLPVLVYAGDQTGVRRAFHRALDRDLTVSVYTDELFSTSNDNDNRAAVAKVATDDLVVAGFLVAGETKQVDKVFDKLKLHP